MGFFQPEKVMSGRGESPEWDCGEGCGVAGTGLVSHSSLCLSPGVSPSGPGVVVMQLNVPNGPQAPQNPPVVQWSHCKYYSLEQRGQKPGDLYNPDTSAQVLGGLGGDEEEAAQPLGWSG